MAKNWLLLLAVAVTVAYPALAATEKELAGSITTVDGVVSVIRDGQELAAEKGLRLYPSDVLRTGENGGVGLVLRDDTTLSLGPNSELKMSEFTFKPDEGILGMSLRLAKGTLVYISGQITKLAPGSATIETPAGVAAVRGTKLLVEVPETRKMKAREKAQ